MPGGEGGNEVGLFLSRPSVQAVVGVLACLALSASARAGTVPFVVAEKPGVEEHRDSFVLPLSTDADIAHARDLIARGPDVAGASIVTAEIAPGSDGVNRNVLAEGQPLWDWHVTRFEGFADFGIELTDGNPTLVQEDVPGWIDNTNGTTDSDRGHIGFWSYTVVAELPGSPAVPIPAALSTAMIGLAAVVAARAWPGTPWGRR
jgi:hypothetical protein